MLVELLDEGGRKASLGQMDGDGVGSDLSLEVNVKEPFDGVHEIDLEVLSKKALERQGMGRSRQSHQRTAPR